MNFFIVDFVVAALHNEDWGKTKWTRLMKTIRNIAIASTIAFSTLVFAAVTASVAEAGPIVSPGHYCLSYDEGGTDCSFTSYSQCLATASGIDAKCYGKTFRDDDADSFPAAQHLNSHGY
ncbi:DUF3551 domain-containing protein [Bradyrhizobium sp. AUGA SZCCT0431]|uniref:DUF3551 domain-containing protein n=1 Tax=Bradyrhizobium sp. AUGA SZCCT0431 TaxID=2807674 RepID=UPI001BA74C93|nr:DUF3551 domain-containing protein [Bradyrhizobium sp. AUGA SZCCT0431]MBR1147083.1 DUF3551 domain-containing protein [Bradyrhizobium sp. AUGA SZCCT0431]